MATKTLGTLTTTSLTAVQKAPTYNATPAVSDTDLAAMNALIWNDKLNPQQLQYLLEMNVSLTRSGLLYVPNRGVLRVFGGDWVAVDQSGWPILIGSQSLPQTLTVTGTTASGSKSVTALSANVLLQGWWANQLITGSNIATGTTIAAIASNGLSLTLSQNATGSGAITLTAGSWTHN